MSERYTRIYAISENLYTEDSPVVIMARALLKDNTTGETVAQLKFKNISGKTIKALKISIRAFDTFGTEIEGVSEHQYLDLSATQGTEFGHKTPVALPDPVIRSFECECTQIIFLDDTKWEPSTAKWHPLSEPKLLSQKSYSRPERRNFNILQKAKHILTNHSNLWLCIYCLAYALYKLIDFLF